MRARAVAVQEEYLLVDAGTLRPVPPLRVGAAPPAVPDLGDVVRLLVNCTLPADNAVPLATAACP